MLAAKSKVIACLFFIPAKVSLSLDTMEHKIYDLKEAKLRIEQYCAKEDRCQQQVLDKLRNYGLSSGVAEDFLIELILGKFVDEERYARSFCRGKFKIKKWGRRKITFELKKKRVSDICISKGLEEIEEDEYLETLTGLLYKKEALVKDTNLFARKKKMADYMVRKGYEPDLVWEAVRKL
jgi:regulatory protein